MPRTDEVRQWIIDHWRQISAQIPEGIDEARLVAMALEAIRRTDGLDRCSTASLVRGIVQGVALGLPINDGTGRAWLIPRKGEATFQLGYRGLIDLAYRDERVELITSGAVYEHDEIDVVLGASPVLRHVPATGDRGRLTGAYAVVHLRGARHPIVEWVGAEDIDRARRASGGRSPAWRDWSSEMARRLPLRRALKLAPVSEEIHRAVALSDDATAEGVAVEDVMPSWSALAADHRGAEETEGAVADVAAEDVHHAE